MTMIKMVNAVPCDPGVSVVVRTQRRRLTGAAGKGIDYISNDGTTDDADDGGEGNGCRRFTERDAANKYYRLYTLSEDGDQGQDKQSPLSDLGTTINSYHTNASKEPKHWKRIYHEPFPSKASWSFTLHLAFALSILSIVIPTTKMRMEATREKIASHNSSDLFHRFAALVNQTAMNAAPIARAINRPTPEPMKIYNATDQRGWAGEGWSGNPRG